MALNNLTNFLNLITLGRFKKTPQPNDVVALGTPDRKYDGGYKPTFIRWEDLVAAINSESIHPVKSGVTENAWEFVEGYPGTLVAQITFATPFADANYSPYVTAEYGDQYTFSITDITANGFKIVTNSLASPQKQVHWGTIKHGES
jgi:hypothetical protein